MEDMYSRSEEVLERLYLENSGFQNYVDHYCYNNKLYTRQQAFKHAIIREIALQYMKR